MSFVAYNPPIVEEFKTHRCLTRRSIIPSRASSVFHQMRYGCRCGPQRSINRIVSTTLGSKGSISLPRFVDKDAEDCAQREFNSLRLLETLGVAPRPLAHVPGDDEHPPIVVYEYMEGETWDRRKPSPSELHDLTCTCMRTRGSARPDRLGTVLGTVLRGLRQIRS